MVYPILVIISNNKAGIFQSTGLIYLLLLVVPIQANNSLFTNSFNNCLVLGPFNPIFSATCSVLYSTPASIMAKICYVFLITSFLPCFLNLLIFLLILLIFLLIYHQIPFPSSSQVSPDQDLYLLSIVVLSILLTSTHQELSGIQSQHYRQIQPI